MQKKQKKRPYTENKTEYGDFIEVEVLDKNIIRTKNLHNQLIQRQKIDLGRILGKNSSIKKLVKPVYKFAKLVIEISNKV